jgi:hypothetical protein
MRKFSYNHPLRFIVHTSELFFLRNEKKQSNREVRSNTIFLYRLHSSNTIPAYTYNHRRPRHKVFQTEASVFLSYQISGTKHSLLFGFFVVTNVWPKSTSKYSVFCWSFCRNKCMGHVVVWKIQQQFCKNKSKHGKSVFIERRKSHLNFFVVFFGFLDIYLKKTIAICE